MRKFIDIDGNLIDKETITSVSKISESYPIGAFATNAWFEFSLKYNDCYLTFHESFKIRFFTNKPKNKMERSVSFDKLNIKRNSILEKIK